MPRSLNVSRWVRFLLAGGINFMVTYLIYIGLMYFMSYEIAYLIAYLLGVVIAYGLNALYVFRVSVDWRTFFKYPTIYIVQYALSALLLWLLIDFMAIRKELAPFLVVLAVIPVTYMMNKKVLKQ